MAVNWPRGIPQEAEGDTRETPGARDFHQLAVNYSLRRATTQSSLVERRRSRAEPTPEAVARRIAHRREGVACVSRSAEYLELLLLTSTGEIPEDETPQVPDAYDTTITKRQWERYMQDWRVNIRGACARVEAHRSLRRDLARRNWINTV